MKQEYLKLMKCPYCGSGFELGEIYREKNSNIIDGFIVCECSEFPIIDEILNLKVGYANKYILDLIKRGEFKHAVEISLNDFNEGLYETNRFLRAKGVFGQALGYMLSVLVKIRGKRNYNKYSDYTLPLYSKLGDNESEIYLKNRFSSETLWSLYPFIPLLKESRERVLDLSCGIGHSSFILSSLVKPRELVCADYSFRHLYLAKKYFVDDALYLCIDANYSLPFKDGVFSSIIMLDAFHYIRGRSSLAREMERTISSEGILLLFHLHNSLNYNICEGHPLTPNGWLNLFENMHVKLLPERNVVEDFICNNELNLSKEYTELDLNASNALIAISDRDGSNPRILKDVWGNILKNKGKLIINPIYSIEHEVGGTILTRKFPSESFKKEFPLAEKYIPEEYTLDEQVSKAIIGRTLDRASIELLEIDLLYIEELMRKFIIINVPKNYL